MRMFLTVILLVAGNAIIAQKPAKVPGSIKKADGKQTEVKKSDSGRVLSGFNSSINDNDDDVKEKLIKLALKNAEMTEADANIEIAKIDRKKAGSSLLSSVNVSGNINEFVVTNSPVASFYPKYNIGISIPLDLFAKTKATKKTADQQIIIGTAQKERLEKIIKARVLTQYENYKEKKELVQLQKMAMEDDVAAYQRAQKEFKDDAISLEELNRIYKASIAENAILTTKEKDLRIAIIGMEEQIGMPLHEALKK
jgi:outer membrane protein TolC